MCSDRVAPESVSRILADARSGDRDAYERLLPLLYAELHGIAERQMRRERSDHTLQPTALVHEAFLRLMGPTPPPVADRAAFLRAASRAMRRVLVDHARARAAAKRGRGLRVTLSDETPAAGSDPVDMLALDGALDRLSAAEPRVGQVVELRVFAGLEVSEVAQALGVSEATVKRDWRFARAWLTRELELEDDGR